MPKIDSKIKANLELHKSSDDFNGSKMEVAFLRNDIGIRSESFFAQMERVLASLRVQSYNAKKGNPNFVQICGVSKC